MASLSVSGVSKSFATGWRVLDDISIDVASGEFVTLLGPSGCGKTTLLKSIAGFHAISAGSILIDGKDVTELPPERRDTAMCFQSYALFPHMTVAENILFGPRQSRVAKDKLPALLDTALHQVDLTKHADKLPSQLSGGQQQRVALARAMAMRPGIILFDEPLSNLDAKLREQVRLEIKALQAQNGFTSIYVTHDQSEALAMSDRIVVLNAGRIEQLGTPEEIYARPVSRFVADFIGAANIQRGRVTGQEGGGRYRVETDLGALFVISPSEPRSSEVYLCWRPDDAELVGDSQVGQENVVALTIATQAFQGNVTDVFVTAPGGDQRYRVQTRRRQPDGATLQVKIDASRLTFLEPVS